VLNRIAASSGRAEVHEGSRGARNLQRW